MLFTLLLSGFQFLKIKICRKDCKGSLCVGVSPGWELPVLQGWLASPTDAVSPPQCWDCKHMPLCPELVGWLVFEMGSHHVALHGLILNL